MPLQEAPLVNFVPGSALTKSEFRMVIVVFSELRLKKATYISPAMTKLQLVKRRREENMKINMAKNHIKPRLPVATQERSPSDFMY